MGNHTKLVPRKLRTTEGEHKLKETDLFLEIKFKDSDLFLKGVTLPEVVDGTFSVKTFQIKFFNKCTAVLFQVAEGVVSPGNIWRFGYDDNTIGKKIYQDIAEWIFSRNDCKNKETIFVIVSAKPGELLYKEVKKIEQ